MVWPAAAAAAVLAGVMIHTVGLGMGQVPPGRPEGVLDAGG